MFQRRGNREDLDHGGWSCFPSAVAGIDVLNPAVSFLARGNGRQAWYGWPTDPALEQLAPLLVRGARPRGAEGDLPRRCSSKCCSRPPYLPLGQILQPTVYRQTLAGILPGFAKFWSVRKI